ncbi:MAG: N-acetyltransferase [Candidatus Heimdallarchaeota archaeon]|nr:N-acetyltransferase [Candidatus Heimdallarchaeota archaeon]HUU77011.1 GNAT family N-acetyltransferase [candidate division Zixibacteria bacterium]
MSFRERRFKTSTEKEIKIRLLNWTDLNGITKFHGELYDSNYFDSPPNTTLEVRYVLRNLEARELAGGLSLVAENQKEIIAEATLETSVFGIPVQKHIGKIGIVVLPEWRRLGIGTELITALEHFAIRNGILTLWTHFERDCEAEEKFYCDKHKYAKTGLIKKALMRQNKPKDHLIVQKELPRGGI